MSPWRPSHALSNALSFFLLLVILDDWAMDEGALLPRAHSVRAVASSAAFLRNWSISKVLEAATWRSNPFFALFYFRDLSYTLDSCHSGPLLWGLRFNLTLLCVSPRFRVFSFYCVRGHSRFMWVLLATLIGTYVTSLGLVVLGV